MSINNAQRWINDYESSGSLQAQYSSVWFYVAYCHGKACADQQLEQIMTWLALGPYGASIACNASNLLIDLLSFCRGTIPHTSIGNPPESLVNQWWAEWTKDPIKPQSLHHFIANKTTQWHYQNEKN